MCVFVFAGRVHPCGDRTSRHGRAYSARSIARINILSIRTQEFRNARYHFGLPTFFVNHCSVFESVRASRSLGFKCPIEIFSSASYGVSVLPFVRGRLMMRFLLSSFGKVRRPPHSSSFSYKKLSGPGVLPGASVMSGPIIIGPSGPLLTSSSQSTAERSVRSYPGDQVGHSVVSLHSSRLRLPHLFGELGDGKGTAPL